MQYMVSTRSIIFKDIKSSVESQKGIITIQQCSVETQKDNRRSTKNMTTVPFCMVLNGTLLNSGNALLVLIVNEIHFVNISKKKMH